MAAESSNSTQNAGYRKFKGLKNNPIVQTPLISSPPLQSTRCKSSISSLFLSTFVTNNPNSSSSSTSSSKKKHFSTATFRGLGCATPSEVSAPDVVRSSADWQAKRVRRKKHRNQRRKKQTNPAVVVPDVWCSPGIAFVANAAPVDCVVARKSGPSRGRADGERNQGERLCVARQSNFEQISALDSPPTFGTRRSVPDQLLAGHYRHLRGLQHAPVGLSEIMVLQSGLLLGRPDTYDRHQDWQLDVDNMTYEELLELGDRIGHVSTGLREEDILCCLRKVKHSVLDALSSKFSSGTECKCSICQEEYKAEDELGKLQCGHSYHMYCIKQWLSQKNACPVCKAAAAQY